jgi:hypothetical protein
MLLYLSVLCCLLFALLWYQVMYWPSSLKEGLETMDDSGSTATTANATTANATTAITADANSTPSYQPYNVSAPNQSLILAQQNAGNIEVLKGRIDSYDEEQSALKKKTTDLDQAMQSMQTQIDGLVQQQAEYAQDLAGSSPATITGTQPETAADSVGF